MKYRTIVVDPPWRYKGRMVVTGNAPGRTKYPRSSGTDYPTMSIEEIAALPIRDLADENGAHLYLWTTNTHIEYAWGIMRGWGFMSKQLLTWCKKPKGMIGFGAFSPCTEFVLFGAIGKKAIHIGRSERRDVEKTYGRREEDLGEDKIKLSDRLHYSIHVVTFLL